MCNGVNKNKGCGGISIYRDDSKDNHHDDNEIDKWVTLYNFFLSSNEVH